MIDELASSSIRQTLAAMGGGLHQNDENPPRTLGSRNLLQRLTLVAALIENFRPHIDEIPQLAKQAKGKNLEENDADVQAELMKAYKRVRDDFAPLAFLYNLRTHGGLAHSPNRTEAGNAAQKLGLPRENWHRSDYFRLLNLVTQSIRTIATHLDAAG